MAHKATELKRGGFRCPSSHSQTLSASAEARWWPLGWMGSPAELSGESGSLNLEAYVICATVTG